VRSTGSEDRAIPQRIPLEIPFGWFCVGYGDELAPGELRSVRYFGRDLVLFRTEGGVPGLVAAVCPHLGAHLASGGAVVGESIRCPFHHWAYDVRGRCVDIPYAKRIPRAAARDGALRAYPVVERNQVLWAWYHPHGKAPWFEVEIHPEVGHPDWTPLRRYMWTFDGHPQEIGENGVDPAHFRFVHHMDAVPAGTTRYDGVRRTSTVDGERTMQDADGVVRTIRRTITTVQQGAGQKWLRITLSGRGETLLMALATPIEKDRCELRFAFTRISYASGSTEELFAMDGMDTLARDVDDDIAIWNRKTYNARPLLCDGDGPIAEYRRYFAQFYVDPEEADSPRIARAASV
jgi:nitrite reductase/ring-hydroxylating ferredoxin subunit